MSNQYREEGKRGVKQTSFMKDLDVNPVFANKSQIGFLKSFVSPLYQLINEFEKCNNLVTVMLENIDECRIG